MKILLFHPSLLPPKDYGGIERVTLWLAKGLLERGHEVWVGAYEGSVLPPGVRLLAIDREKNSARDLAGRIPAGIELVHLMAPISAEEASALQLPCVVTVHGNGKPGERFQRNSVFLSLDHARRHGANAFVHNGIDPAEYTFDPRSKEAWLLFLSKTSWRVKNVAGAMRVCRKAGVPLKVAGGNRPYLARMRACLTPGFEWLGPVSGEAKARYLSRARALVFPVTWPEPFGLVVAEALVSGTPVLASRRGSLPELVPAEVGAVLGDDEQEWVALLKEAKFRWDPGQCRDWALKRFHYIRMAEDYEQAYRRVIAGEYLNPGDPVARDWRNS